MQTGDPRVTLVEVIMRGENTKTASRFIADGVRIVERSNFGVLHRRTHWWRIDTWA